MSRDHPPLLLRLAVVVGGFTLLLGIAGVVLVVLDGDDDASAAGPGLREHVRVVGAAADASLEVEVHWEEGANLHVEAARRLASAGHVFLLPPELTGRAIEIEVRESQTARLLAHERVVLRQGQEVRIAVAPDPAAER
jgi:hypothetical protein